MSLTCRYFFSQVRVYQHAQQACHRIRVLIHVWVPLDPSKLVGQCRSVSDPVVDTDAECFRAISQILQAINDDGWDVLVQ